MGLVVLDHDTAIAHVMTCHCDLHERREAFAAEPASSPILIHCGWAEIQKWHSRQLLLSLKWENSGDVARYPLLKHA